MKQTIPPTINGIARFTLQANDAIEDDFLRDDTEETISILSEELNELLTKKKRTEKRIGALIKKSGNIKPSEMKITPNDIDEKLQYQKDELNVISLQIECKLHVINEQRKLNNHEGPLDLFSIKTER